MTRTVQVLGASDPTSGTVSLNEVVRGLGALYERGWKPHRTILIAGWDGEEVWLFCPPSRTINIECLQYGLVGSTEWGEDFVDWIQEHVVAYLNLGECPIPPSKHVAEWVVKILRFLDPDIKCLLRLHLPISSERLQRLFHTPRLLAARFGMHGTTEAIFMAIYPTKPLPK